MDELIGTYEAAELLGLRYAAFVKRWERGTRSRLNPQSEWDANGFGVAPT